MPPRKNVKDEETDFSLFDIAPDELDQAIADLPSGDNAITVYRVREKGQGHPIFVATYNPEDFSLEAVQENHGGGRFNIVARRGREVIKKMRVEIEGEPKTTPYVNANYRRVTPEGRHVFLNRQEIREREEEDRQAAAMKSGDGNMMIALLMEEIRGLKAALGQRTSTAADDDEALLRKLTMYKQLFAPSSNPVQDQTQLFASVLQKGLELGAQAATGEVKGDSWVDMLKDIAKEFMPVIQQVITAKTAGQPLPPRYPAPPTNPNENKALRNDNIGGILPNMNDKPPQASGFGSIAPSLQTYLPLIVPMAARDANPGSVVEMIDNNISEEQKPFIIEWLNSASWFNDLCTLDPRIQLQAAWWQDLHDTLLEALTNPEGFIQQDPNGTGLPEQ